MKMKKGFLGILLSFALVLGQGVTASAELPVHSHNEITFNEWSSTNSLPASAGDYSLTVDVMLDSTWNVPSGIYGASATWDAEKLETLPKFDTDVSTASDGCMMMGLPGEYIGDQQVFLDRINAIRREACEQNIINPETGMPLTNADYVPLKWSHELEEIARIRAAETSMTADHIRTNGDSWQSVDSEYTYVGECVAWNYDSSATAGIDQWNNEKENWMNGDENGFGHYTTLIRPSMRYVGGATFYSPCTEYPNTTLVEFYTMCDGDDLDETFVGQVGECVQKLEVNEGNIQGDPYIKGTLSAVKGDERPLFLMTDATYSGFFTANTEGLLFVDDVNWSSSNSDIASVSSDGNVTAEECGSATITAQAENGASASAEFTVEHVLQKVPAVEATCTEAGNIEYWSCENCGKLFRDSEGTQEISQAETVVAAGHDLSKTEAKAATCTAAGNIEYWKCSECGKYFSDEGTTEIEETATVVPVKPHTLTHVEAKAATCTEAGNIEYWKCSECGKYFSDEGTTEIEETATIEKADPVATAPAATATYGQTLADVTLTNPEGNTPGTWAWADTTLSVGDVVSPAATFKANFTPSDTVNYNSKTDMDVAVTVGKADATDAMTAAAVSIEARNGETATVSYTLPDGASYGTATNENTEFFTVSAANGLVLTSAKNWTASDWAADAPKTFTVAISGATNYKDYTLTVTVTPIYKAIQTITAADVTATYGDTGKKIEAGTTGDGTLSYAVKSGDAVTVDENTGALTIVKAGSAVITVTAAETATYAKATRDVNVTINKANAVPATVTANNRNYDGTKKNLVTVDESTLVGGKMYYALGENATTAPEDNLYTTSIPTKTDAGTYYVWYKAVGDAEHSDTAPVCLTVTISSEPIITGADLVLNGSLDFRFYVALPTNFDDNTAYMTFSIGGKNARSSGNMPLSEAGTSTEGQKIFSFPVYSIEMAQNVEAVFHYKENDEAKTATLTTPVSVKDYLALADAQYPDNTKLHALTNAARDYGHYMQLYLADLHGFTVGTDDETHTYDYQTMPYASVINALTELEGFETKWNNSSPDTSVLKAVGYYDTFNETTTLNILFRVADGTSGITATADEVARTVESVDEQGIEFGTNTYRIRIPDIAANNLDHAYRVQLSADGNTFCDMNVSALTYVSTMLANGSPTPNEAKALTALYNYNVAADGYNQ